MKYKIMKLKKYYDAVRTNKPFLDTSPNQKKKILINILKFFKSSRKKPLAPNYKPVTAQIEPTSECNLKCEMCIRDKIGVPIGTMSFEDFKKILDKLDCLFKVHLSGQGEPFLNSEIFKMIKYANGRGILINTSTNGTILTKNVINKICEVEIGEISISLESTKKEIYEKIRGGAKFDIVMSKVNNLISELDNKKKKTIVSFAVTILKDNLDEIPEFVKLAKRIGVKKILFQTVQNKEDYVGKYNSKMKSQIVLDFFENLEKKMKQAKNLAKKYKINLIYDEGETSDGCIWPWRGIYITWDGYVTACCKILNYKDPEMGNLIKEDFWKIWNGKIYKTYRKLLRKRKAPLSCKGCNMV